MKTKQVLGVIGALALTGLSTLILASPAQAAPECKVTETLLTNRPDNGLNGDWAHDTFTRTVTICGEAPDKGGPWVYQAVVHDVGTFVTIAGPTLAPGVTGPGLALAAGVVGTMDGGFTSTFTAPAEFDFGWEIYDGETYDGAPSASQPDTNDPSTGWWIATLINSDAPVPMENWSWTYKSCNEQWINNEDTNTDENGGNITGAVPCPTRTTPAPAPGNGGLAETGTDVTGIVIAGGSALLVGAVLIAFTARRRARSHS